MSISHYAVLNDQELVAFANGTPIWTYWGTGQSKQISGAYTTGGAAANSTVKQYTITAPYSTANPGQSILGFGDALTYLGQLASQPWTLVSTGFAGTGAQREWILTSNF